MKGTSIAWLPEVGDEWETYKVSHAFSVVGSGTTPDTENRDFYDGDVPWVTTSELRETLIVDTSKKVTQKALREHSALKVFPKGTLLIAMYGATIGRLGVLGTEACMNQACCALSGGTFLQSRFVYYWLLGFRENVIQLASGGGQPNISQEKIRSLRVPAPAQVTQIRIAAFLDRKTAAIDALIAKKERLIALLQEKRQALITQAVTKGLDPNVPMKESGVDSIGSVPTHWKVQTVGQALRIDNGPRLPINRSDRAGMAGEYPYWGPTGVIDHIDHFRYSGERAIIGEDGDHFTKWRRWSMTHWASGRFNVNNHAHVVDSSGVCWARWFYYAFLHRDIGGYLIAQGVSRLKLTREALSKLPFAVPPLNEQVLIVARLDVLLQTSAATLGVLALQLDKLREYRQALITAAVTGKIDVSTEAA